jgi:hypothetical protein
MRESAKHKKTRLFDSEVKKYVIRFGCLVLIIAPILYGFGFSTAVGTLIYKVCMVAIAILLGEALWLVFFKPSFGRTEDLSDAKILPVLLFRGIIDGSIVLAFCLGL